MSLQILVDVGNTTVAWCNAGEVGKGANPKVEVLSTRDLLHGQATIPESWHKATLIVASVVPKLDALLKKDTQLKAYFVSKSDFPEILLKVDIVDEVGIDRIVNVSAACQRSKQLPLVVVDFGTATTFDVLTAEKAYVGGAIAPGIGLSRDILNERTAKLPHIEIFRPEHVIGHNTVAAMASGLIRAYEAMVDGMVLEIEKELGAPVALILTGGYADLLRVKHPHQVEKHLCFEGLEQVGRQVGQL